MRSVESATLIGERSNDTPFFHILEITPAQRRRQYLSLAISLVVQIIVLIVLISFGPILRPAPSRIGGLVYRDYVLLHLPTSPAEKENPRPKRPRPAAQPTIRLHPQPVTTPPIAVLRNLPAPEPPKVVVPPKTAAEVPQTVAVPVPPAGNPRRELAVVRTDVFRGTGSSAEPTINRQVRDVQTGGFGDPKGFQGEAQGGSHGNVATLGSFDLPAGPGYGNGSGGSRGAHGVVASAGFGNGIMIASGGGGADTGGSGVRSSGFADAQPVAEAPKPRAQPAGPKVQPVEILSKPKPIYSEEARRLRVEGEVVLEAVFSASGELRGLRVLRGLGHGLDEAALYAAGHIRFKPAQRDGQPVDTTATLHILFQLAD